MDKKAVIEAIEEEILALKQRLKLAENALAYHRQGDICEILIPKGEAHKIEETKEQSLTQSCRKIMMEQGNAWATARVIATYLEQDGFALKANIKKSLTETVSNTLGRCRDFESHKEPSQGRLEYRIKEEVYNRLKKSKGLK